MLGIGIWEFSLIAIVLLLAVGPDKMPTLFKAIGKGLREVRRASRDLQQSIGIDELLRDDPPAPRYRAPAPGTSDASQGHAHGSSQDGLDEDDPPYDDTHGHDQDDDGEDHDHHDDPAARPVPADPDALKRSAAVSTADDSSARPANHTDPETPRD